MAHYELSNAQLTFIGQSQNTTFRAQTSADDKFLLRIHSGIEANSDNIDNVWQHRPVIESELLWLDALHKDTHLTVPRPVRNRSEQLVTEVSYPAFDGSVFCTLLRWVEGEHLDGEPTPEQSRLLGVLMAQLHQHASQWQLPPNFTRPDYDAVRLESSLSQLSSLRGQGIISTSDYQVLQTAVKKIQYLMAALERNSETWGLLHADLQDANYLSYNQQIRPIDFGRCGFGFYLYDVALSLGYLNLPLHSHFLQGYESLRALPADYQSIIEAFFLASIIDNFAFLSDNPLEHTGLSHSVPLDISAYFRPYLKTESFLFNR